MINNCSDIRMKYILGFIKKNLDCVPCHKELTKAQLKVFIHKLSGYSVKEISRILNRGEGTVKYHYCDITKVIFKKYGYNNEYSYPDDSIKLNVCINMFYLEYIKKITGKIPYQFINKLPEIKKEKEKEETKETKEKEVKSEQKSIVLPVSQNQQNI